MKTVYDKLLAVRDVPAEPRFEDIAVVGMELTADGCSAVYTLWEEQKEPGYRLHRAKLSAQGEDCIPLAVAWRDGAAVIGSCALAEEVHYRDFLCCREMDAGYGGDIEAPSYGLLMGTFFRKAMEILLQQLPYTFSKVLVHVNLPMGEPWRKYRGAYAQLLNEAAQELSRRVMVEVVDPVEAIVSVCFPFYKETTLWAVRREGGVYHAFRLEYRFPEHQRFYFQVTQQQTAQEASGLKLSGTVLTDEKSAVLRTPQSLMAGGDVKRGMVQIGCWKLMAAFGLLRMEEESGDAYWKEAVWKDLMHPYEQASKEALFKALEAPLPEKMSIRRALMEPELLNNPIGDAAAFQRYVIPYDQAFAVIPKMLALYRWKVPQGCGHCTPYDLDTTPGFALPPVDAEQTRKYLEETFQSNKTLKLQDWACVGWLYAKKLNKKGALDAVPADPEVLRKVLGKMAHRMREGDLTWPIRGWWEPRLRQYEKELKQAAWAAAVKQLTAHYENYAPFTVRWGEEQPRIPEGLL